MGPFDDLTPAQRQQVRKAQADRRWREGVETQDRMHRVEEQAAARLREHVEAEPDRGTNESRYACPVCDRDDITITKKGLVRVHGSKQGWPPGNCFGSGQKPKDG